MIVHSEQINELAAALAAAQQEMENARKNSANPHFKSSYADLGEILNTVRPALSKHGLSLVQMPAYEDGVVCVETLLMHASGQWLRGSCSAAVQKADPQGIGSATTYLRRYSAASICGIAQEDDDGNAAGVTAPARKAEEPAATDKQVALIRRMYASHVITDEERASLEKRIGNGFTASKAKADRVAEAPAKPDRVAEAPATEVQVMAIQAWMENPTITDEERAGIEKRMTDGLTAAKAQTILRWLSDTITERTKAEKAEATELVEV